jgi:ribosomal protein S18 acetylase RimI-like enzyme
MASLVADSPRRIAFVPAKADEVVAFCIANGSAYDAGLIKMLTLELTSDPAGVVVIGAADGVAVVATVVDRTRNGADAASLETLGVRVPLSAEAFTRLVVEPAVAFARGGPRRALHVSLPPARPAAEDAERALRDAGFAHAYDAFEMRRPAAVPLAAPAPLPPGWAWADMDVARADEAHGALAEIFRDAPATHLPPLPEFREAVASGAARWRMLIDGGRLAGLVRPVQHGARGELRVLGRVPAYRARGIGPRLVGEGLRILREGGAGDIDLAVEAANERALDLYRSFGFQIVTRTPVFALSLR